MTRAITILWVLAAVPALALGDRVTLAEGEPVVGTVTFVDDDVQIETPDRTLRFDYDAVLEITYDRELRSQLQQMEQQTPADDAEAIFTLGKWARDNGLTGEADELFRDVLRLQPNHLGARRHLGYVRIDRQWMEFDEALALARSRLQADETELLLGKLLPALEDASTTFERLRTVRELLGHTQLRARQFEAAKNTFADLRETTSGPISFRYTAIAEIISNSRDGMIVLSDGPNSLADPLVLQAALYNRAQDEIEAGRALMNEAEHLEPTDLTQAGSTYGQARAAFERADALIADIARGDRLDAIEKEVEILRSQIEADSTSFDEEMEVLGEAGMPAGAYRNRIERMLRSLGKVEEGLKSILEITASFPREFILEIQWAREDLDRIEDMRETLATELEQAE